MNQAANHLSNCEHYALQAALKLHELRYAGTNRDELITSIMQSLLIIAEEARQGLAPNR